MELIIVPPYGPPTFLDVFDFFHFHTFARNKSKKIHRTCLNHLQPTVLNTDTVNRVSETPSYRPISKRKVKIIKNRPKMIPGPVGELPPEVQYSGGSL